MRIRREKEKGCFAAKMLPLITRARDNKAFLHQSWADIGVGKDKEPVRLLKILAGILNTGSFPGPVYSFTLTIESVYLIRSKVDHPFASLV